MFTSLDVPVLRARAWDHGGRPLATPALSQLTLNGVTAIAANGLLFLGEEDAERARPAAQAARLREAGSAPLMTLELDCALAEAATRGVERVVDAAGVEEIAELVREVYGTAETGLRTDLAEVPGADAWLLREDGHAVAGLVATADPDLVAIWSMAVPARLRRRGRGEHLLRAVLGHYALEGARRACLIATPEGERLYARVGFEPVERLAVWQPA